ncbi:MAG: autotransporter-associated beta strand repeat-containing protein [Luteolibacter sp.]
MSPPKNLVPPSGPGVGVPLLVIVALAGLVLSARAVDAIWSGATDGEWNTATNWNAAVPTAGTATFNNGTNTAVHLATAQTQFRLVFDSAAVGGFTFGGQKFIAGGTGQAVTVNATVTTSPVISFNNDFQITPTGRTTNYDWSFTNNSPTAGLVFNAGVYPSVTTASLGGRLNIGGAGGAALQGVVSDGSGPGLLFLKKSGDGVLTLGNANTHTGGTEFSGAAGTIILGHKSALGAAPFRLVDGGGTLAANVDLSGANAIPNTIHHVSATGVNTTANLTVTLTAGSNAATWISGTAPLVGDMVTAAANLPYLTRVTAVSGTAGAGTITFDLSAGLSGTGLVIGTAPHSGSGAGTTTYGGTHKMEFSGVQNLTTVWSTSAAAVQTFNVTNTADVIFSGVLQQSGGVAGLTKTGPGKLVLSNANTFTGNTTISAGSLQLGNGGSTGSLSTSGNLTNDSNLTINRTDTVEQGVDFTAAAITGTGSLTQAGSGTTVLTAANTFAGATTISAGTLKLGKGGTTGSLSISSPVTNNGTLVFNRTDGVNQGTDFSPAPITGTGSVVQAAGGVSILSAANSYSGATVIQSGEIVTPASVLSGVDGPFGNSTSAIVLGDSTTPAAGNVVLTISAAGATPQDFTFSRNVNSSGTADAAGRTLIRYQNTTNGALGTLTFSGSWALSDNLRNYGLAATRPGMMVDFTGAITGGNTTGVFRINADAQSAGRIRLSNSGNTYANRTIVTKGTLLIAGDAGAASGVLGTHTTLRVGENGIADPAISILTDGAFLMGKAISLADTGAPSTLILGGTQASASSFTGNIDMVSGVNNHTLELSQVPGGTVIFSGVISANPDTTGITSVVKTGGGTAILSNANTWDGSTTIAAGTLLANNTAGSATGTGAVTVSAGATLGGFGSIGGPTTVAAGATIVPAGTLTVANDLILDGSYTCALDGPGTGVKISVAGNLDIDGATLAVSPPVGGATGNYVIATYSGTLTGSFAVSPALPAGYSVDYSIPGQIRLVTDYGAWVSGHSLSFPGNGDPAADADLDGLTNQHEYAFGLDPDSGSSVSPIVSQLDKATGLFSYTRRKPSLTNLAYACEYSTTLGEWVPFTPDSTSSDGGDPVETVTVDVPDVLLAEPGLFVRVLAR